MLKGALTASGMMLILYLFKSLGWLFIHLKWKATGTPATAIVSELVSEKITYKDSKKKKISHKEYIYNFEVTHNGETQIIEYKHNNLPANFPSYPKGKTLDIYFNESEKTCYVISEHKKEILNYLMIVGISLIVAAVCVAIVFALYS